MKHYSEQIALLERRLEFLKKWTTLWDDNASIQQVTRLVESEKYLDIATEKDFMEGWEIIFEVLVPFLKHQKIGYFRVIFASSCTKY